MFIINQDRDEVFTLNDKQLFPARLYVEDRYYNGQFMGWNIIGKWLWKKVLLGTYDTEPALDLEELM